MIDDQSISASSDELDVEALPTDNLRLELAPFGLEHLHDYEPGGHHPVHLGDCLGDDGRYRVIHKLGNGGTANIWLCRDLAVGDITKYVAVKVLMADLSKSDCPEFGVNKLRDFANGPYQEGVICLPLGQFMEHGPNGDHFCFVYPLLGPKASLGLFRSHDDIEKSLRAICFKVVQAVALLHSHGICHGGEFNCPE